MKVGNEERRMELSSKIFDMGTALINEGESKEDYMISNTGNIMMLISGLLYDSKDMVFFSELCDMFSAKKLLDNQMELGPLRPLSDMDEDELYRMMSNLNDEIDKDLGDEDSDDEDLDYE